jgi:hypothetical protein
MTVPDFSHPGRIVGFIAVDGGELRVVVGHRIQGGHGETLRRASPESELACCLGASAILDARATAFIERVPSRVSILRV